MSDGERGGVEATAREIVRACWLARHYLAFEADARHACESCIAAALRAAPTHEHSRLEGTAIDQPTSVVTHDSEGRGMTDKELGQAVNLLGCEAAAELGRAVLKHKRFNSLHEGYGVIMEEVCEFFDEVRAWQPTTRDYSKARKELIQVAAMALRTILDVCDATPPDVGRAP